MNEQTALADSYGGALDRARLRMLMHRSNRHGATHLAGHVALVLGSGTMVYLAPNLWWAIAAMIAHGGVLILLFCGLHETVHRTAFLSRRVNDLVAMAIGFAVFVPATHFRAFHMDHHRFTQDPDKDPELAAAKPVSFAAYLWHVLGVPFAWSQLRGITVHAAGRVADPFIAAADRPRVVSEARVHVVLYVLVVAVVLAGWTAPLIYWLVPAVLGQPFLRLVLLAEHTGCAPNDDMHANTRTTLTNPFVRFVMWNMPYHIEHHVYPGVPFHALPMIHREMVGALGVTARGYARFHFDYLRALLAGKGLAFVIRR